MTQHVGILCLNAGVYLANREETRQGLEVGVLIVCMLCFFCFFCVLGSCDF
jgi:hypothetical protein